MKLPLNLDKIFSQFNGYTELFKDLNIDYSLTDPPIITEDYLKVSVKGLFTA